MTGINQEWLAEGGLAAKGFEVYVPKGKKIVSHARRKIEKTFPVFSRYIFVKFDASNGGYSEPIRSTDGIIDILRNNWEPVPVDPWVIEEIKIRENSGHFDQLAPATMKKQKWSKSFQVLKSLLNPVDS